MAEQATPHLACRLCGTATHRIFTRELLGRHTVGYHQCMSCGLTQTDEPTWLAEAYTTVIAAIDTGAIARNQVATSIVATFSQLAGIGDRPGLDFAGGHGVFVRLMRDRGFRFLWADRYAENVFARGFEWDARSGEPFVCTAFEVLEHFVRPVDGFADLAAYGAEYIITSTELHPGRQPAEDWFYLAPESGQHVAFYQARTLQRLGSQFGYPFVTAGPRYQLFARRPTPGWWWRIALRQNRLVERLAERSRKPLTDADSRELRTSLEGQRKD